MSKIDGDMEVSGAFSAQSMTLPLNSVGDANVNATLRLGRTKVTHQFGRGAYQQPGAAIVAQTAPIFIARAAGTLVALRAAIVGAIATDASRHVYVELKKSTGGGAFATVLSAPLDFTNASTLRTAVSAAISAAGFVAGDIFQIEVTVAGGAGSQAEGLAVEATFAEAPD